MGVQETDPLSQLSLPPGFRFYPTDEELLVQYLCRKVAGHHFSLQLIGEIDLYKFDPWVLPSKALFGEKEWYFFSPRDRKYPNGSRPNRVAGSGYWKATGTDKIITSEGRKVGIKKALVFYVGKAPKGTKTNWIMHEYRVTEISRKNGSSKLDEWVLCRIYKKKSSCPKSFPIVSSKEQSTNASSSSCSSQLDDMLESFPELDNRFFGLPRMNSLKTFQNMGVGSLDWRNLGGFNSVSELVPRGETRAQSQVITSYGNSTTSLHVPAVPPTLCQMDIWMNKVRNSVEEEEESGVGTQRADNSGIFQQNSNGLDIGSFSNSMDPYGLPYPTQTINILGKRNRTGNEFQKFG